MNENNINRTQLSFFNNKKIVTIGVLSLILLIITVMIYSKSVTFGITYSEDVELITSSLRENYTLDKLCEPFVNTFGSEYYKPMLDISFLLDASSSNNNPFVYHRTNLILHLFNIILLLLILYTLGYPIITSSIFALIFAVHPLLASAVSWIGGRAELLLTFYLLLSFLSYLFISKTNNNIKNIFIVLSSLFYGFALFTDGIVLFYMLIIFIYNYLIMKNKHTKMNNMFLYIGYALITIIWFIFRTTALNGIEIKDSISFANFIYNLPAIFEYIGKIFIPINLVALSSFNTLSLIFGIIFIIGIAFFCFIYRRKLSKNFIIGIAWLVGFIIIPQFFRIPNTYDFYDYAESIAYISMVGFIIMFIDVFNMFKIKLSKPVIFIITVIILLMIIKNYIYQDVFKNPLTYWSHQVELSPKKARGYFNLGLLVIKDKNLNLSQNYMQKCLELNPEYSPVYSELAGIMLRKKDWKKTQEYAQMAIKKDTNMALPYYYLGKSNFMQNRINLAILNYQIATKKSGFINNLHLDLGYCYFLIGDTTNAAKYYKKSIEIEPDNVYAYSNLGILYSFSKKYDEAEKYFQLALSVNSASVESYIGLMRIYKLKADIENLNYYRQEFIRRGGRLPADLNN